MEKRNEIKTHDDLPYMLTVEEVAIVLGVSRATAYELAHAADGCPHIHIGKRIIVPRDAFIAWLHEKVHGVWAEPAVGGAGNEKISKSEKENSENEN